MQFEFVTREQYRDKTQESFIDQLQKNYGDFYLVPEGGTNELAVKGCEEILTTEDEVFDFICCSMGTGGTVSGLRKSAKSHQQVLGFSSLKTDYLKNEIDKFAPETQGEIILDYHFGGYGKVNNELIQFINEFYVQTNIPLDPIYTGKTMFGIMDLIQKKYFKPQSKILMIHTGGLQGIQGMNQHLEIKKLPTIQIYGK
jgi:1-aminocyclopropane-1-carboxylate deaminase